MIDSAELTPVSLPAQSPDLPVARTSPPGHRPNRPDQSGRRPANRSADDAERSIDLLYRLHSSPLHSYLVRLTLGDDRLAEDILQETLLRAWLHLQKHPTDVEGFRPWLYTVSRRILVDVLRRRNARPPELRETDLTRLTTPDNDIERLLASLAVRDALAALRPEHRTVVIELFYRGRTAQEVATALGIPLGTVKSRTHYALRALRRHLAD